MNFQTPVFFWLWVNVTGGGIRISKICWSFSVFSLIKWFFLKFPASLKGKFWKNYDCIR